MEQLTTGRISLRRTGTYAGAPVAGFVTALHIIGLTVKGNGLAAEAKTGTGRQRKNQQNFQTAWEKRGGIYVLFRSVDELLEAVRDR